MRFELFARLVLCIYTQFQTAQKTVRKKTKLGSNLHQQSNVVMIHKFFNDNTYATFVRFKAANMFKYLESLS